MDTYSKFIFTVIAVALVVIASKAMEPKEAHAGAFSSSVPTVGDLLDLRDIHDAEKRSEAQNRIMRSVPLVRVQGGQVSADVN